MSGSESKLSAMVISLVIEVYVWDTTFTLLPGIKHKYNSNRQRKERGSETHPLCGFADTLHLPCSIYSSH